MARHIVREAPTLALLLVAGALLLLPVSAAGRGASVSVLMALLVATVLTEGLPLHFPDRSAVTLTVLPAALLWYYFGPMAAAIGTCCCVLVLRVAQRQADPVVDAARAIVAVWCAHGAARLAVASTLPAFLIARQGLVVFCVVYAVVAPALGKIGSGRGPRPDLFASLAMTPLAVILVALTERTGLAIDGVALLPLVLLGLGAILLLVRSNVNMMTLHRQLATLARRNEEINHALTVERDTITAVVNFSGEGIFTVDKALRIRQFNPALATLIGQREDDVVGHAAEEILGAQHAPSVVGEALRRALQRGQAVRVDSVLVTPQGQRELSTSYSAIPGRDGTVALGVGVVRDVTEEREEARTREDYFSIVTHDLRNPLTSIVGNTQLLSRELDRLPGTTDGARRLLGRIEKANGQLMRLVNNLLELQRIESGGGLMSPDAVALLPLVDDVVGEFRADIIDRAQTVNVAADDVSAWADRTWCREIVTNLLSNAVKYTPRGGRIDVRVESHGAQVSIVVADTGLGLTPEEVDQLFTKFFRSNRPEMRATRGSGVGLALAKRMAERMGGDIEVRSAVGAGSAFTVLLPAVDGPADGSKIVDEDVLGADQTALSVQVG